jgi:hypothetical protein
VLPAAAAWLLLYTSRPPCGPGIVYERMDMHALMTHSCCHCCTAAPLLLTIHQPMAETQHGRCEQSLSRLLIRIFNTPSFQSQVPNCPLQATGRCER